MSINDISPQLEAARQEVAAAYGEKSGEQYGQYLFLLRLLARRGLAPQLILDAGGSSDVRAALASQVFPRARFEVFEDGTGSARRGLDDFISNKRLSHPDLLMLYSPGAELEILQGARQTLPKVAAVLCQCRLTRDPGEDSPTWIDVANLLAGHDMHLFDVGKFDRNGPDQRIASVEMLFMRREHPALPALKPKKTLGSRFRKFLRKLAG